MTSLYSSLPTGFGDFHPQITDWLRDIELMGGLISAIEGCPCHSCVRCNRYLPCERTWEGWNGVFDHREELAIADLSAIVVEAGWSALTCERRDSKEGEAVERGAKIATAAGVLMAGLSVAMLFRHDGSRIGATPPDGFDHLVLRGRMELDCPIAPAVSPTLVETVRRPSPATTSSVTTAPRLAEEAVRKDRVPVESVGSSVFPAEREAGSWSVPRESPSPMPAASRRPLRHHRIMDGDTLASLARRYLGSEDRAGEIFELNREVLPSPMLLPIGMEIRIPPRDAPSRPTKASPRLIPVPGQT
jgi:nucleoid-associated protein YgaU